MLYLRRRLTRGAAAARHLRSLPIPAPCALRLLVELDRPRVAGPASAGPALNRRRRSTLPPSPPGRRARPAIPPPACPACASSTDRARSRARYAVPSPISAPRDSTGSPARLRPAGQPPAARSARPALPPADGLAPGGLHLHPAPAAALASPTTTRHSPTLPGVRRCRAAVAICAISFQYQNNIKMIVFRYWRGEFIAPATVGDLGSTLLIRRGRIRPDRGSGRRCYGPSQPRRRSTDCAGAGLARRLRAVTSRACLGHLHNWRLLFVRSFGR